MQNLNKLTTGLTAIVALAVVGMIIGVITLSDDGSEGEPPEAPAAGAPTAEGEVNQEAVGLFVDNCGQCHTLAVAGTDGQVGPNLDDVLYDEQEVLDAIRQGPGQMQANIVEGEDAELVAELVAGAQPVR